MLHVPKLVSERAVTTILRSEHAPLLADFYRRNREYLRPWFPKRHEKFYTEDYWHSQIESMYQELLHDKALYFCSMNLELNEILAVAHFTNIMEDSFKGCFLNFALDETYQGQGMMLELLSHTLNFVFCELDLHRIMASYPPKNRRAHRILQQLGFEQEGFARSYLKLDGLWQDHHLCSLINPLHDTKFI